ncbi:MAG: aminopeptidase [Merdibacter sp.]
MGRGSEQTQDGVRFNANLPTEEVFTMPHRLKTNGVVHASKPLDYNGQLIEDFHLEFQDGKVCGYDARKGKQRCAR